MASDSRTNDSAEEDNGDSSADEFLRLFAHSQRRLHLYILAMVFNPTDAADILQETNLVLWQKFDQFEPRTNFLAWAREIARYRILRHRQLHAKRLTSLEPDLIEQLAVALSDSDDHRSDRSGALDHCLEAISDKDRELVMDRYAVGATVRVLAERLKRSENGISQSLARIRQRLRECIERTQGRMELTE